MLRPVGDVLLPERHEGYPFACMYTNQARKNLLTAHMLSAIREQAIPAYSVLVDSGYEELHRAYFEMFRNFER